MQTVDQTLSSEQSSSSTQSSPRNLLIFLYIAAVALYWSSLYFYIPTLPVYVKTKVDSLAIVGTILSMYGLWQALIRLPLGIAADWAGWRKPFIIAGFMLSALGAWLMAEASSGSALGFGRAITGLAAGTWVPLTVVFSSLFPHNQAVRATAILTVVNSIGRVIATGMNGWLISVGGGYGLAFYVAMGAAFLAVMVMLPAREQRRSPIKPGVTSIARLITRVDVLGPSLLGALAQYVTWAATLSFTPILAAQMGANDQVLSLLTSGSIVLVMVGNMATASLSHRMAHLRLASASFILLSVGAIWAAYSPNLVWLIGAQVLISLGSGIAHPLLMGLSIAKVETQQRTTAMGLHQAVYGFGMFAGPWISGGLAEWIGIQPMFAVTGLLCIVLAVLGVRWLKSSGL